LAALDPTALELGARTAQAELSNAVAQLANATASEARQRTLLEQNTTAQAQYDLASQARDAATASVVRAQANLTKAREQLSYAELRSDFDGVVTAISGEVGQVVTAGQSVMSVARPDIREAVVDVSQDLDGLIKPGTGFDIVLQIDPSIRVVGRVREIAPQADPTTRTRRIKITLDNPPPIFRLGTTITAALTTSTAAQIKIPSTTLLERDGKSLVWIVNPDGKTVSQREVRVGRSEAGEVQIADGLAAGTRVVIAGVHSLVEGQAVRIADKVPQ
jgi:RND family efflux transporter MFP subunit